MGETNMCSNWIMNRATAIKHLFIVHETTGKAVLLCCEFSLFPREILCPGPIAEPKGSLGSSWSWSQEWRHQHRQGWHVSDQLLFICMLPLELTGVFHSSAMTKPWNIWWHQGWEIQLLAMAVQMICAFHYSEMIIKPESREGKWQTKANACLYYGITKSLALSGNISLLH